MIKTLPVKKIIYKTRKKLPESEKSRESLFVYKYKQVNDYDFFSKTQNK